VKGYRLWDLTAHKLFISRDVISIEDKMKMEENNSILKETTVVHMVNTQNHTSSEVTLESETPEVRWSTRERSPPS